MSAVWGGRMQVLERWLSSDGLMPHGFCYHWNPGLLGLHAISDTLIALAYFCMPVVLIRIARKRPDLPFSGAFLYFSVFIAACGATHLMEVLTLWVPSYWLSGGVKLLTAGASIPTAVFLARLAPQALELPRQEELQSANEELRKQGKILREREERFREMAENILEMFWVMDAKTQGITYISPAFEEICEMPVAAAHANPTFYNELIHPEDRPRVLQVVEGMESTRQIDEEFRIVCPSGRVKWIRVIGCTVRDGNGSVQRIVGTAREISAYKEMEAILRESEDRYRDLVEHSTDLICTHNLAGRLLSVNELPAKVLGYTPEELLNRPMRDFLVPEGREQFDASLVEIQKTGFVKGLMAVLTKSGEQRIWEYHNTLRTDTAGPPIVRGIAHDVTDEKRMEKALRRSEEKFAKAFLASPYPMIISSMEDSKVIEVNGKFVEITGFSRKEAIGRTSLELELWACPSDRDEVLREVKAMGRVPSKQIVFQTKAGKHLIVAYSGELIELAGRPCLLSVCEDITERKHAEAKLQEYEKVVEGVEEMIAVVDREYRYLVANRAFTRLHGRPKEEILGRAVPEVLDRDFFERVVREKLDRAFRGEVVRYELRHTYPGAGLRDLQVSYFPIEEGAGIERVLCVLWDITERKHVTEELRRLSGQLLRLQDEERRKIARDLHDSTGQDLVALSATLSQIRKEIPSSNRKLRKELSQCSTVANRCLREVRTVSYLLHPPMLDESGLEDAVRHFTDGFVQRTGILVHTEVSASFGRLPQEVEMGLFRVVQESLVNIQRHSGSRTARIELRREGDTIALQVSDRGRGISANDGRKNGTRPARVGVGIPSMEERVKQVGGRLEIHSGDLGTTVEVIVPIHG
jgi:PAS domain S-box-containing protein